MFNYEGISHSSPLIVSTSSRREKNAEKLRKGFNQRLKPSVHPSNSQKPKEGDVSRQIRYIVPYHILSYRSSRVEMYRYISGDTWMTGLDKNVTW